MEQIVFIHLNKVMFINLVDIILSKFIILLSNSWMYLQLIFRGVKFDKLPSFNGRAYIKRGRKNTISIGSNCAFLSRSASNLIGINRPCIISSIGDNGSALIIGNNCGFSGTVIGCFNRITIGNNVKCGANTLITDSDWHPEDPRSSPTKPIIIEDNVWLGVNVIVLKGVTIGKNSVIGAGSVVTKSIPPNMIAAGNPCKVIKEIRE